MKTLIWSILFSITGLTALAGNKHQAAFDTVKLQIDSDKNVYYQKAVTVSSKFTVDMIYNRIVQFMATKNIQQNYGYEQDGRLIFTTMQDLNINPVYVGDDNDAIEPYTAQFAIIIDVKHGAYRYTIDKVTFFIPMANGNKREPLFDMYIKANNTDSKRVARNAKAIIASFERYLASFTQELRMGVEQKSAMYNKF